MNLTQSALALALSVAASPLLAQDPPAPPGGFPIAELRDQNVTWSDGYRTRMDLYRPAVTAPATGWPGVLAIHGGSSSRRLAEIQQIGRDLAGAGYVVYAYDVREDGQTGALNPGWPTPITAERKLLDSAESHGIAATFVPGELDSARLAVTGISQGGNHAIQAAAWSGQVLPLGGFVTRYPRLRAVAPEIASLDKTGVAMPGGTLVNDERIDDLDPTNPFLIALSAGNYTGAFAALQTGFQNSVLTQLRTSTVPMLVSLAWRDAKHHPNPCVDALQTLSPQMPRRVFLTSGGHSTPKNVHERLVERELRRRWFDRYLKSIANGVDQERYAELAVIPENPDYADVDSVWQHRQSNQWPPTAPGMDFHLRGGGSLTMTPPSTAEVGPTLLHRIAAGFDLQDYVQRRASINVASELLPNIPKRAFSFVSAPLPRTQEVFGRGAVELFVIDSTGTFQLTAELAHVSPAGLVTPITIGTVGRRDAGPGAHRVRFDLIDIAYVVPAGDRLQIKITNLADHRTPGHRRIRFAPYFSATDTSVVIGPNHASKVTLPLRDFRPSSKPRLAFASALAGIQHDISIDAGSAFAGELYFTFLGNHGEAPGLSIPGAPTIPLNPDGWTSFAVPLQNTAAFPNFVGTLSARGRATARMRIPPPFSSSFIGTRLTFTSLIVGSGLSIDAVTGPTTLITNP